MVSHPPDAGQQPSPPADDRVVLFHNVIQPAITRAGDILYDAHARGIDLADEQGPLLARLISILTLGRTLLQKVRISDGVYTQIGVETADLARVSALAENKLRGAK